MTRGIHTWSLRQTRGGSEGVAHSRLRNLKYGNFGKYTYMSYAAIMVYVEADATPEHRVRLAATLAGKFNSMLIGLSALALPPQSRQMGYCSMARRPWISI